MRIVPQSVGVEREQGASGLAQGEALLVRS